MTRRAQIISLKDALAQHTIGVFVTFRDGAGVIDGAVPATLNGVEVPRSLSAEWCASQGLKNEAGSATVLRSFQGSNVVLLALGEKDDERANYRLAGAAAARAAGEASVAVLFTTENVRDGAAAAQALTEGALLASYAYKAAVKDATFDVVPLASPLPTVALHDAITAGVERGATIADAVNWAKYQVDTPAGTLPPKELARRAEELLSGATNVTVEVWSEPRIKEERLGGLLGVGQGSAQPTRVVWATYDPGLDDVAHVVLVGKGVTFDSGGLSIKPAASMTTMKTDMTGAAVVTAVVSMASQLALGVKVTAIALMTENLLGDRAVKPGDVLTIRNGMTIEVLNTDAEGRLILADGLSLAAELSPDLIVDVATLTGAQNVALGDEVGAVYATSDELADAFLEAGARADEPLWRLPLVDAYEAHIESDVADVKNQGRPPKAGSIVAALLLRRFTQGRAWVHLDVAGPSRAEAAHGFVTKGATAFSARAIYEYLTTLAARSPN